MLKYDYQRSITVLLGKSIKGLVWYCLSTSSKGLACYSIKRLSWYCTKRLAWYSIKRLAWYSIKRLVWYSLKRLAWYYQCLSTSIESLAWYKIRRLAWYCCITSIGKGGQRKMRQISASLEKYLLLYVLFRHLIILACPAQGLTAAMSCHPNLVL
jgi:hypothetical protein